MVLLPRLSRLILAPFYNVAIRRLTTAAPSVDTIRVCVVGAGPGGFYTAKQVLKHNSARVDIIEALPCPFGLVRYGVAPDHPEVKNVINTFSETAEHERCSFYGNVRLGQDVTFSQLKNAYDIIVLSFGADFERRLNIPGENLGNCWSARRFVSWYNGHPEVGEEEKPVLTGCETVAVIGHGNVALDVARILLAPLDQLKTTDISERAVVELAKSRVKRVILIGRRGPLEVSFTIKELRELVNLKGTFPQIALSDLHPYRNAIKELQRPRKRLSELILQTAEKSNKIESCPSDGDRMWELKFCRSPLEILASSGSRDVVGGIQLGVNELKKSGSGVVEAVPTGLEETLECEMVLKSVGYVSRCPDREIPFDEKRGIIRHSNGRVDGLTGVYCSGWVKTGSVGVIVSTMNEAFGTGQCILDDISNGTIKSSDKPGFAAVAPVLQKKGVDVVSFSEWKKLEKYEKREGEKRGKLAEKVIDVRRMLEIAKS